MTNISNQIFQIQQRIDEIKRELQRDEIKMEEIEKEWQEKFGTIDQDVLGKKLKQLQKKESDLREVINNRIKRIEKMIDQIEEGE
jgi:SMC interacting uncharacterized protein involved in chromosome segregation